MNLESIVPSLELCKKLNSEDFQKSALVWFSPYPIKDEEDSLYVIEREEAELIITKRDSETEELLCPNPIIISAPTLSEIMEEMPRGITIQRDDTDTWFCIFLNIKDLEIEQEKAAQATTAAFRLWMQVNEREVKI